MKKLLAIILAITLTFSMAFSASAVTVLPDAGEERIIADIIPGSDAACADLSSNPVIQMLVDVVHRFVEKVFAYFGLDCPLCDDDFEDDYEWPFIEDVSEVLEFYNGKVNTLKEEKLPVTVFVEQEIYGLQVTAPSVAAGVVEALFNEYAEANKKSALYHMENGVDENGVKLNDLVLPAGKESAITEEAVAYGLLDKNGGYAAVNLYSETCTFDGTTTQAPANHSLVVDPIDLAELGNGMISEGTVTYFGSELAIWVDSDGNIETMSVYTPVGMEFIVNIGGVLAAVEVSFDMYSNVAVDYVEATGVVAEYNKIINDLKYDYEDDMVIDYTLDIACALNDSSISSMTSVLNKIIESLIGRTEKHHVISEGYDENGRSIDGILPPGYNMADIRDEDVVSATKVADGDESVITIKLKEDTSSYDGMNLEIPEHHVSAVEIFNPATLDLSPIEITSAEMYYPGATIEARLDNQGRLVYLRTYLPVSGTGVAKMSMISFQASLEGSATETYEIEYK